MSEKPVRQVGASFEDADGLRVHLGVDYGLITITAGGTLMRLTGDQAELFSQLFLAACWQAGRQSADA